MLGTRLYQDGIARSFFANPSPAYLSKFHIMLSQANPKTLAASIRSVMLRQTPLVEQFPNIPHPKLIIAGEADPMYLLGAQRDAAEQLPKGQFHIVPGKHISPIDAPDAVSDAIVEFLAAPTLAEM